MKRSTMRSRIIAGLSVCVTFGLSEAAYLGAQTKPTVKTETTCRQSPLGTSVSCTSTEREVGPYYGGGVGGALLAGFAGALDGWAKAGQEREVAEAKARETALASANLLYLEKLMASRQAEDELAQQKREAALRIFQPKVNEVIWAYVDSIGLRQEALTQASQEALDRARDIFLAMPDATASRIREDLSPIFAKYVRRKNDFQRALEKWATAKKGDLTSLDAPSSIALADFAVQLQSSFLADPTLPVEVKLNSAVSELSEVKSLCGFFDLARCKVVKIKSDNPGDVVLLDGRPLGQAPVTTAVRSSKVKIEVGDGDWRYATYATFDAAITEIGIRSTRKYGEPAPARSELESILAPRLPEVPEARTVPIQSKPRAMYWTLASSALSGIAVATIAKGQCVQRATAPAPFGGFIGGQYLAPGEQSVGAVTKCQGLVGAGGFTLALWPIDRMRRALNARAAKTFTEKKAEYTASVTARSLAETRRRSIVDSAMAVREEISRRSTVVRTHSIGLGILR
jgi:hypothetical protein